MKRLLVVHGMKRSGNHAIINWLLAQERFIFFNNVIPIVPILKGERTFPPTEDFARWFRRRWLPKKLRFLYFPARLYLRNRSLIASLEDHELQVRPFRDAPCAVTHVLILRDPYNLFASRIRKGSLIDLPVYPKQAGAAMNRVLEIWKSHAREFLGQTNHLENKRCIYFNAWFQDRGYRQAISRKLDLAFTDDGFSRVSRIGGGSSFDSTRFDGSNRNMDLLNRQNSLSDSERQLLEFLLADEEIQELARRIDQASQATA